MEISVGDDVETRTDVERKLDRNSVEFVFETSLANECESDVAVVGNIIAPETKVSTNTCIPTEVASDSAGPLINTSQADGGETIVAVPAKVELKTVATQTVLIGKFCIITLTTTNADTKVVLCVCSHRKSENCYEC